MVTLKLMRDEAEALYDLLMEDPYGMLHASSREEIAAAIAEAAGFTHEPAPENQD